MKIHLPWWRNNATWDRKYGCVLFRDEGRDLLWTSDNARVRNSSSNRTTGCSLTFIRLLYFHPLRENRSRFLMQFLISVPSFDEGEFFSDILWQSYAIISDGKRVKRWNTGDLKYSPCYISIYISYSYFLDQLLTYLREFGKRVFFKNLLRRKKSFEKFLSSYFFFFFLFRSVKNINEIKEKIKEEYIFLTSGLASLRVHRDTVTKAHGRFSARERVASFEDSNASLIVINEKSARSGRRKTRFSSRACLAACSTAATFSHPCSTIFFAFPHLITEISLSLSLTAYVSSSS